MSKIKIQKFLALDKIREQAACKRLILYGAGTAVSSYARIALWLLNSLEIKPTLFIDDDESRWEKEFEGIPVHSPEFLKTLDLSLQTIIITSNYFESIFKSLEKIDSDITIYSMQPLLNNANASSFGINISFEEVNRRMHTHYSKLDRIINHQNNNINGIIFNALDIQVTEKCTMKCLDCSNLMQYYSDPKDIPIEEVIKNVKLILLNIDRLADARVIGGEPFLNKKLFELIEVLVDSEKVEHITIYSNATFVPSNETLKAMSKVRKLHVEFTDYEALSKGKIKLPEIFKRWEIPYFFHKPQNWTDSSRIFNRTLNNHELSEMFESCCVNDALTLLGNRLYHCPFSANLYNINAIDPVKNDWIDLSEDMNEELLREKIQKFYYGQMFLNACRYCAGRDFQQEVVTPAIQVKRFIPIHLRKEWNYVEHSNTDSSQK
jgi:hypothetical protein